jgi:hypothetical protein
LVEEVNRLSGSKGCINGDSSDSSDDDSSSSGDETDSSDPETNLPREILEHRYNGKSRKWEWKIWWSQYPKEDSTWEPFENLDGNVLFAQYEKAHPRTKPREKVQRAPPRKKGPKQTHAKPQSSKSAAKKGRGPKAGGQNANVPAVSRKRKATGNSKPAKRKRAAGAAVLKAKSGVGQKLQEEMITKRKHKTAHTKGENWKLFAKRILDSTPRDTAYETAMVDEGLGAVASFEKGFYEGQKNVQTKITAGSKITGTLESELSEMKLQLHAKDNELKTMSQLQAQTRTDKFKVETELASVQTQLESACSEMQTLRSQTMNTINQSGNVDPNANMHAQITQIGVDANNASLHGGSCVTLLQQTNTTLNLVQHTLADIQSTTQILLRTTTQMGQARGVSMGGPPGVSTNGSPPTGVLHVQHQHQQRQHQHHPLPSRPQQPNVRTPTSAMASQSAALGTPFDTIDGSLTAAPYFPQSYPMYASMPQMQPPHGVHSPPSQVTGYT